MQIKTFNFFKITRDTNRGRPKKTKNEKNKLSFNNFKDNVNLDIYIKLGLKGSIQWENTHINLFLKNKKLNSNNLIVNNMDPYTYNIYFHSKFLNCKVKEYNEIGKYLLITFNTMNKDKEYIYNEIDHKFDKLNLNDIDSINKQISLFLILADKLFNSILFGLCYDYFCCFIFLILEKQNNYLDEIIDNTINLHDKILKKLKKIYIKDKFYFKYLNPIQLNFLDYFKKFIEYNNI